MGNENKNIELQLRQREFGTKTRRTVIANMNLCLHAPSILPFSQLALASIHCPAGAVMEFIRALRDSVGHRSNEELRIIQVSNLVPCRLTAQACTVKLREHVTA